MDQQKLSALGVSALSIAAVLAVPQPLQAGLGVAAEICGFLADNCIHWDKSQCDCIDRAVADAVEQTLKELPPGEQAILLELTDRQTFSADAAKAGGTDALRRAMQAQASRMESYLMQGGTPKAFSHIASAFQTNLIVSMRKYPDLAVILSFYQSLCGKVEQISSRIDAQDQGIAELREWIRVAAGEPRLALPGAAPAVELIGREDALTEFHKSIEAHGKICVVSGIGGVGKTEFVRKYLERYRDEYRGIGWFEYRSGFLDTLAQTAGLVINPRAPADDWRAQVNEILGLLRGLTREDILVFDNVHGTLEREDAESVFSLSCRVILTTRADFSENGNRMRLYPMDFLTGPVCQSLFLHYLRREPEMDEREALPEVVRLAGRHTLALELMAKTCRAARIRVTELLRRLEQDGFNLEGLAETVRRNGEYDGRRLAEHIMKLYDAADIKALGAEAERLLVNLCALPLDQVRIGVPELREWLGLPDLNLLNRLHERGWLRINEDDTVSMHGVIAEALRMQLAPDAEKCQPVIAGVVGKVKKKRYETHTVEDGYFRCAEEMLKTIQGEDVCLGTLGDAVARVCQQRGDYAKALEFHQKALAICEKALGREHPDTATMYNNLAGVYRDQGDYAKALEYYQHALEIKEKVLGTEHPRTATTYHNLAGLYRDQGNYAKALEYFRKALSISEKVLGTEHPDAATTYNNLAGLYLDQGEYANALKYHMQALAIREKVLGTEHPDTATTYNNLAGLYRDQEDYAKTLEFYQKALAIREKVLGTEHPDTAATYNNLALVYQDQGDYAKALEYYRKDLAISEKVLGAEHPSTAITYVNLGSLYAAMKDWKTAKIYCQKAYDIFLNKLKEQHPLTQKARKWLDIINQRS